MSESGRRVLLIGYGNPGRFDDGLGPALAAAVEEKRLPGVRVEANYQLTVEDAADAAEFDTVVFVDADTRGPEPFWVKRIEGGREAMSFSTHSVSPQAVLMLTRELFQAEPDAYLMGIRGYEFNEFGEGLSQQAERNLAQAIAYVENAVRQGGFDEVRSEGVPIP